MIERICLAETKRQLMVAIIIGAAVVSFWRGVWDMLDLYLFPQDHFLSSFFSIILGLMIIMFSSQSTRRML